MLKPLMSYFPNALYLSDVAIVVPVGQKAVMLRHLIDKGYATDEELIANLWPDPDKQPECYFPNYKSTLVQRLRMVLKPNWKIDSRRRGIIFLTQHL